MNLDNELYALSNPYAVDGTVSWHSPQARGYASMNCYLIRTAEEAFLIDTGLSVHESAIIEQLHNLISPSLPLSIFAMRQGEFDSVCNVIPIAKEFNVTHMYGQIDGGFLWSNFREDHPVGENTDLQRKLLKISSEHAGNNETITLGQDSARKLEIFRPPIRLLNTSWIYDDATRTLFTSDMFTYALASSIDGPWVLKEDDQDSWTTDRVGQHLDQTRYWWLKGARVQTIRGQLENIFNRYQIDRIAPSFGKVLEGRRVVERHWQMLDEYLAAVGITETESLGS